MGYDCTLHLVDEQVIRTEFVPRLLGVSDRETALDRVHPGAAQVWERTRELLRTGDPAEAASAVCVAALMFSGSMLPYRFERDLALSLAMVPGRVFSTDFPFWADWSPSDLFTDVLAARPELRFPYAFSGNYSAGMFVPTEHVPEVLAWVEGYVAPLPKGQQRPYRGLLAVLRAAVDRKLAYWEATDLAMPAGGEFPGDPDLMWAQYLGSDSSPTPSVETAPMPEFKIRLDRVVDRYALASSAGRCRSELWNLATWPPQRDLCRDEFWVAAARHRSGRWLAFSTVDTAARPRSFTPILVEGSDGTTVELPRTGPDSVELYPHSCYWWADRPVVLHEIDTHHLLFDRMAIGDTLPGPLWLGATGQWELIPGIAPARVVANEYREAHRPSTGLVHLADGSEVLIWNGAGYELAADGSAGRRTFTIGGGIAYLEQTFLAAGTDGFYYISGRALFEIHRGGPPRRHVEEWTNVMAVRPGPAGGLLLEFGSNDSGDVGALYFPETSTYIPLPPEMFDEQEYYQVIFWNQADDRIVVGQHGYVSVPAQAILARSQIPCPGTTLIAEHPA